MSEQKDKDDDAQFIVDHMDEWFLSLSAKTFKKVKDFIWADFQARSEQPSSASSSQDPSDD